jgi:hypothetical protein
MFVLLGFYERPVRINGNPQVVLKLGNLFVLSIHFGLRVLRKPYKIGRVP